MDVFPRGWDKTYALQFVEKEGFEGETWSRVGLGGGKG